MVLRCVVFLSLYLRFVFRLIFVLFWKARYAKKVKDKLKAEKVVAKERMRRAREHVSVGPLHAGGSAGRALVVDHKDALLT